MMTLALSASDEEILAVVRLWVSLLASQDYQSAFELTDHSAEWTPDLIRQVIEGYGLPDPKRTHHRVTPIDQASGGRQPEHEVTRSGKPFALDGGDELIGDVLFDLPLDGSWSDLTATFDIRRSRETLWLVLDQIHVF
jgi:hypothetical protein